MFSYRFAFYGNLDVVSSALSAFGMPSKADVFESAYGDDGRSLARTHTTAIGVWLGVCGTVPIRYVVILSRVSISFAQEPNCAALPRIVLRLSF